MAKPFAVPGNAVGVTAVSTNLILSPPPGLGQGGYGWAVLTNCSPWLCTVNCATGAITLQPYTVDIVDVSGIQQLIINMSVPTGGSATPPPTALAYVQADWYAMGGGLPSGTYPLSLTAQALQAFGYSTLPPYPTAATGIVTVAPGPAVVLLSATGSTLSWYLFGYDLSTNAASSGLQIIDSGALTFSAFAYLPALALYTVPLWGYKTANAVTATIATGTAFVDMRLALGP